MHWGTNQVLAACAAATLIAAGLGFLWRRLRGLSRFLDDWHGTDSKPGVMARLDRLEAAAVTVSDQLKPNGGASMYDKVTRIDDALPVAPAAIHIHTDGKAD